MVRRMLTAPSETPPAPITQTDAVADFTPLRRQALTITLACWSVVGAVIDLFFRGFIFSSPVLPAACSPSCG